MEAVPPRGRMLMMGGRDTPDREAVPPRGRDLDDGGGPAQRAGVDDGGGPAQRAGVDDGGGPAQRAGVDEGYPARQAGFDDELLGRTPRPSGQGGEESCWVGHPALVGRVEKEVVGLDTPP